MSEYPISVPEGFVEFSMQVMDRATLVRKWNYPPSALVASALKDRNPAELVDLAARCLLAAVEPVTIEGNSNAPGPDIDG